MLRLLCVVGFNVFPTGDSRGRGLFIA